MEKDKVFGVDAVILTDGKLRAYFTGFRSTFGFLVILPSGMTLFTDNRYLEGAKAVLSGKVDVKLGVNADGALQLIKDSGAKTLGYVGSATLVPEYEVLKQSGLNLVDVTREVEAKMAVKTEEELSVIEVACHIIEDVYAEILDYLTVGVTEKDVANEMEYRFRKHGASDRSFETIAAFGENAAVPHHESGERQLKEGDVVLLDFGCVYKGYCSDMTRTFVFGTPSEEFVKDYNAVLGAHLVAADGIRAGMTGKEADALARNYLKERNLDTLFTHSLGHGIGVNIHEFPRLTPSGETALSGGMVFSIEPGIYKPSKYGIRIEDTVTLSGGKVKSYMKQPKSLLFRKDGKWQYQ